MAIIDYQQLFFAGVVHINGGHKQTRIGAAPGKIRLYRDMDADPHSVVIQNVPRRLVDIVPWSRVETARPLGTASVAQLPSAPEPENDNADDEAPPTAEELAAIKAEAFAPAPVATRSVNAAGEPVVTLPSKPVQRGGKR